jgi:hypothetical protein
MPNVRGPPGNIKHPEVLSDCDLTVLLTQNMYSDIKHNLQHIRLKSVASNELCETEVFVAVKTDILIFWVVTHCGLVSDSHP